MSRVAGLATFSVAEEAKKMLKQVGKSSKISLKLQAVISAVQYGITHTAKVFNVSRSGLTQWIKIVQTGVIDDLRVAPGRGRKQKLSQEQRNEVVLGHL
jgi:transposase